MCYAVIDIDKKEKDGIEEVGKEEYERFLGKICKGVEESFESWLEIHEKAKKEFEEGSKALKAIEGMCNQLKFSPEEIIELRGKTKHTTRLALRIPGDARNKKIEKRIIEALKNIPEVLYVKVTDHVDERDLLNKERIVLDLSPIFTRKPEPNII